MKTKFTKVQTKRRFHAQKKKYQIIILLCDAALYKMRFAHKNEKMVQRK